MTRVLEQDTFDFWAEFGHRPGGGRGAEAGATWFRTGIPFLNYNGALGASRDVEAVLARVRGWGLPARWILSSTHADEVEAALVRAGLQQIEESPGMIARIDELRPARLDGYTCEIVDGDEQSDEWSDVLCDAFDFPADARAHVREAHGWSSLHEPNRVYLLIRSDGLAVASGLLHWSRGVAGIYGIGVRRDWRGRGLGALATLMTVAEGMKRGATVAILQATKDGLPVYQKLGFRATCSFRGWRIA